MKLAKLHEEFIDASRRPMQFGRLPVKAREVETPIIPVERWVLSRDPKTLSKVFKFQTNEERNRMLQALLDHENETQHHARIILEEGTIKLVLVTKNIGEVTELDQEYAKFADQAFKDVVFAPYTDHFRSHL